MKIETWYDVCCDKCGRHLCDFGSDMQNNKEDILAIAKEKGWRYSRKTNENICPICLEKIWDKIEKYSK